MSDESSASSYFCSDTEELVTPLSQLFFHIITENTITAFGNNFQYNFTLVDQKLTLTSQIPIDFKFTSIFGSTYPSFTTPSGKFGVYKNKIYQLSPFQVYHTLKHQIPPFQATSYNNTLLLSSLPAPFFFDLLLKKQITGITFPDISSPFFFNFNQKIVALSSFQDKVAFVKGTKYEVVDVNFRGLKRVPVGLVDEFVVFVVDDSFSALFSLDDFSVKYCQQKIPEAINFVQVGGNLVYGEENSVVDKKFVLDQFK